MSQDPAVRHARLVELFASARGVPPEERRAWLDGQAADEPSLVEELRRLLDLADPESEPMTRTTEASDSRERPADSLPSGIAGRLGPYQLIAPIGRGTFGDVYLAIQDGQIHRLVAIKMLRSEWTSDDVVGRFRTERQLLSGLSHAGLATIFEAGETEDGRPWFAMEFVDGEPLVAACDRRRLGPPERLRLLIAVCEAVHSAHQRGVIHRDLKSSNILVVDDDGELQPKVIDFGIAKAVGPDIGATGRSGTLDGQVLGTPASMSPEQALGRNDLVDVRTDVHALGVLLHELLVGSPPLVRGDAEPLPAFLQRVAAAPRESLPDRAAAAPRSAASERGHTPASLARALRGDLQWITARAIDPEIGRRYPSADALREDLLRTLRSEPVLAGPPTASYRFSRFVRRNRGLAMAGGALAATVVIGSGAATMGWARAARSGAALAAADRAFEPYKLELASIAMQQGRLPIAERTLESISESGRSLAWQLLDTRSDERIRCWKHHDEPIASMAVSPDGGTIVTTDRLGTIVVHDADSGAEIRRWDRIDAFSPVRFLDARSFVTAIGRTLVRFNPSTGERSTIAPTGFRTPLNGLAVGAGRIVACSQDQFLRSWDADSGELVAERDFSVHLSAPGLSILRDGRVLFPRGDEVSILTPELVDVPGFGAITTDGQAWTAALSPDSDHVAIGTVLGSVHVVDVTRGTTVRTERPVPGIRCTALAFSGDGRRLASGSQNGVLRVLDLEDRNGWGRSRLGHIGAISGAAFAPDGMDLLTAARDGSVASWDVSGRIAESLAAPPSFGRIAAAPDGHRVIASSPELGRVQILDAHRGTMIADLGRPAAGLGLGRGVMPEFVSTTAWSPDGRWMAAGTRGGAVARWDGRTGERTWSGAPGGAINAIAFEPGGHGALAALTASGAVAWIGPDGEHRTLMESSARTSMGCLGFTGRGDRLIVGRNRSIMLVDARTGVALWTTRTPNVCTALILDEARSRVGVGVSDGRMLILNLASGAMLGEHWLVDQPVATEWSAALAPAGDEIVSCIHNEPILWRWPELDRLTTLRLAGPEGPGAGVTVARDGRFVAGDRRVIWDPVPASMRMEQIEARERATPAAAAYVKARLGDGVLPATLADSIEDDPTLEPAARAACLDALMAEVTGRPNAPDAHGASADRGR